MMSLRQNIVGQFKQPHGSLGQIAGFIMARRPSNIERNQWTLDLLDLRSDDRILEIGFGPGIAIETASQIATKGMIVGIDHSQTMLHQARKRNAAAIGEGRVQLHLGSVSELPPSDQLFDKIFSANVVQFWTEPVSVFKSLHQRLAPGGTIATTYMPRHSGATSADSHRKADEVVTFLQEAGFSRVDVKERPLKPVSVICVLAVKDDD